MMTGGGNMPRIAPNPSIRILAKGNLCAKVALLVLLGTLLLAGSAHAAASGAEPIVEPASEVSSPSPAAEPAGETSPPASPAEPAAEPAPEASSSTLAEPVAEPTPEVPLAAEPTSEASSPASAAESAAEPAPEASPPAPVADPAPEASTPEALAPEASAPVALAPEASTPVASPPVGPSKEAKEEPAAAEPTKEAAEVSAGKPVLEQGAESLSSSLSAASQSAAATADNPSGSVAAEVSGAVAGPVTTIFPFTAEELPTTSAASSAYVAALARTIAAQRAEDFTRELGGLGASSTDTYTAGFDSPRLISATFVEELAMGTAARAGAPAPGRSGGSPGGSSPIGPPPGPTPSGTFGGAAGGGSGTALSGFSTFAGHLLLGAPLAMHRLRLSFQPWLTAFFVLIPERPG
jgi:hypothetical protein